MATRRDRNNLEFLTIKQSEIFYGGLASGRGKMFIAILKDGQMDVDGMNAIERGEGRRL
jgi:hypothetical protein